MFRGFGQSQPPTVGPDSNHTLDFGAYLGGLSFQTLLYLNPDPTIFGFRLASRVCV